MKVKLRRNKILKQNVEVFIGKKLVGTIKKSQSGLVYVTRRRHYDHFFRKFKGFGISKKIINILRDIGVKSIMIVYDTGEGEQLYISALYKWFEYAYEYEYILEDGTKDPQLVLPVHHMTKLD